MNREQMKKEIERMNHKIEMRLEEIKKIAQWIISRSNDAEAMVNYTPSESLAKLEVEIRELSARRDTLKEIFGEE